MKLFPFAHATHPRWEMAAGLVLAQLRAQMARPQYAAAPTLGVLYITDHYTPQAQDILDHLGAELREVTDWTGTVGAGIASSNVEYFDEPAMAVMLCALPADQYRVFSGVAPLGSGDGMGFEPHTALIHADARLPDLSDLIEEMASRTATGYLFGGLSGSRGNAVQFAVSGNGNIRGQGKAGGVFRGGMSGVAFGEHVQMVSRVTQGCQPLAAQRVVTEAQGNVMYRIDGKPALDVLLADAGISMDEPENAMATLRATLVGLTQAGGDVVGRTGNFGADVVVRHIIGLDPQRRGVAIASPVVDGLRIAFCRRNAQAARADLVRICAEIREELEPDHMPLTAAAALAASEPLAEPSLQRRIAGAIYVSCAGRGGAHFGGPNAEMQIVRRALGDIPLVGFFASGEIARHHVYGYTGVLTVFR